MRSTRAIHIVGCHAEGEVGDVIVGGVAPPPGDTIWEQSRWIARDQTLRNFVLNEPRGGVFRHVNLLVPPKDPRAAMGWIIMEPVHTPPMSGSNAICVATVLLETGIVPMTEPETRFALEAPGGLVQIVATCAGGKATSVRVTNVASFAQKLDVPLEVEGLGTLQADTAFGGDSFVLVDAARLGNWRRPGSGSPKRPPSRSDLPIPTIRTGATSRFVSSPRRCPWPMASRPAATPWPSSRASSTARPPAPAVRPGWR